MYIVGRADSLRAGQPADNSRVYRADGCLNSYLLTAQRSICQSNQVFQQRGTQNVKNSLAVQGLHIEKHTNIIS